MKSDFQYQRMAQEAVKGLAERIRSARDGLGWSREALARKADCSSVHVFRIEDGRSVPKAGTLLAIAQALGVSPTWLLTGR